MPQPKINGLRELKGLRDLSPNEYATWKRNNAKYLGEYSTIAQQEKLYNTQRFTNSYGKEAAKKYSYAQRLAIEKQDLDQYNNSLINKSTNDTYNPFRDNGTIDPNKGTGNAETFYKIMNMEPQFQRELQESSWLTDPEIDKKVKGDQDKNYSHYVTSGVMGTEAGAAGAYSYFSYGKSAEEKVDRSSNDNIFGKIYDKDMAFKAKKLSPKVDEVYNQITNKPDAAVLQDFLRVIRPRPKDGYAGIPQLAAFYDKYGRAKSSEVEKLDADEMKRWIAKSIVYGNTYDAGTVYDMLDKEAKDYISNHQGVSEYTIALINDMAIGASAYTADKINGMRSAYLSLSNEKVPVYVDNNGHFWGKEHVKDGIYTDPYSGEKVPVKLTEATKSALDEQGIAPDGTTRGLFFNNRYWSDAESTGTWTRKEQAEAKALNGYSSSKAVYKLGEEKDYLWEVAKMAQFALADGVSTLVPIETPVIMAGKGLAIAGKVMTGAQGLGKVAKGLETAGAAVAKSAPAVKQFTLGTTGAVGIAHAYDRGAFSEMLEGNMLQLNTKLFNDSEDNFNTLYEGNSEFRKQVDSEVTNLVNEQLTSYGNRLNSLSVEEINKLTDSLSNQAYRAVAQNYISTDVEGKRQEPEYTRQVTEIAESATSSALTAGWTIGVKYFFVNNFGYRKFLFKDPLRKASSATSKVLEGATEGADKRLHIVERFKDAPKSLKALEIAKITGSQMWGGAWTNFTDELQSAGARKMNEDRIGRYLRGDYDPSAGVSMWSIINGSLNYLVGAENSMLERSTWDAGLVGGIGAVTSVAPNTHGIARLATNRDARAEWSNLRREKRYGEMVNMLVSQGILSSYYEKVIGERQAKEIVDKVNGLIDNYGEFKDLSSILALDMASIDVTNPHDTDAIDFIKAAQIAHHLSEFKDDDSNLELSGAIQKSSLFQNALETIDKITNDEFTDEEAREYLVEYYSKNPSVMQSEENNSKAIEAIKGNAEKLKKGIGVVSKVNEAIEKSGMYVAPVVKARLVERLALDQFLGNRISEIEEGISGSKIVTAGTTVESFGNEKAIEREISNLVNIDKKLTTEIDKAKLEREKLEKDISDYVESKKGGLTDSDIQELKSLRDKSDAADLQVRFLEEQRRKISVDREKLIGFRPNTERRVISSEEIIRLSPEDRARMLDRNNFKNYSKEQQVEIEKARQELNLRSPQLLMDVEQQALMIQRKRANSLAYSMMIEDPEAAAAQFDADLANYQRKYQEVLDRRRVELVEKFIDKLEESPKSTVKSIEEILLQQFKNFGTNGISTLEKLKNSNSYTIHRYEHILDKAINSLQVQADVDKTLKLLKLDDVQSKALALYIDNIIKNSTSNQEVLDELGKEIESPDVSDSDKVLLNKFLTELEELWNQKSSTSVMTKEEKQQAEGKYQEELSKETQRRQEAEEAARAEAERRAVEAAAAGITEADTDTSNDRAAELEAQGLSESDTTTSNESTLTPEQIAQAVAEGEDVELESPTLEEQAAAEPNKVDIIPAPVDDSTDQGNTLPVSNGALLGNSMYRYELNPLKFHGKQVVRKGKDAGGKPDKMSRYFQWMESAGIKLQEIIDEELGEIAKLNPDIYPLFVKVERNATNDDAMEDFPLLVVEYTDDIANIHNDKNGGVLTSEGKQYLVIGTLGFPTGTGRGAQGNMFREVLNKSPRKPFFDANPSERFYVNRNKHTQIQDISSGRLVRQLATDAEVQIRSISELLADEARNPKGLTMGDLKWGIQYEDRLATVNVSERNTVYPPSDGASNLGSVFLLIETANGNYIPAYIRPMRLSELSDGKLKTQLTDLVNELTSTDYKRRLASIKQLVQFLNLTQEGDNILIGTEEKPTVSIVKGGAVIRTYNVADANFDRTKFLEAIAELDPRVNITTSTLSDVTSLEMFDEAGALTTDLAKLGTSGASYNVYAMDADGNPIITTPAESQAPTLEAGSDLTKAQKKMSSERMGNTTYRKDANGNWYTETDRLVTDPRLVEQLNYRNLIRTRDLKPNKVIGMDEVFIVNNDKDNPLVLVRRRGNQIFAMSKEGAVKTINEVNAELAEKARQERLQKELEIEASNDETLRGMSEEDRRAAVGQGSEDVDLGLGENLTEDQIVEQMTGNFEAEATPQQKTAEELVERITSDTSDIHLSEDGATYVDADGKHYARVTSVIAADEYSDGRFEADNPWGLPSTTIGTGVDEFVRDFFDNKLGNMDNLADRYPNATNEQLQAFAKQLQGLRDSFKRRDLTIVPRDVTVTGTVEVKTKSGDKRVIDVAGTLDLLAYDKDGNFYIFDMKTNRSVPRGESGRKKGAKWSKQLSLYKQLLQEKYGAVVKSLEVIPIKVNYPVPKGVGDATTEYTKRGNQLYADGEEYRMTEPVLHDNIPLPEAALNIDYSKLTPAEQAMVRTVDNMKPLDSNPSKVTDKQKRAKEKLARVEAALESPDVKLWSDNPIDNVVTTVTSQGFRGADKNSRLWKTARDLRDTLRASVGESVSDVNVVYRDRNGNTYVELQNTNNGEVKSAIIFPLESRGGDNFTVHFYKTLTPEERDAVISYVNENRNRGDLIEGVNYILKHSNDNLLYLRYRDSEKLSELRAEAYTEPIQHVVQPEPVRTREDINKTGTKSLAELQSKKSANTALDIVRSNEFGKRARALLKSKFPDMPSKTAELERFLQSKDIATTGITDVEQWLKMIEECK